MNSKPFHEINLRILLTVCAIVVLLSSTSALAAGGILDPTFGTNGVVKARFHDRPSSTWDVVLQPDGRIVTLGTNQSVDNQDRKTIVRYNTNGTLDVFFGDNGITFMEVDSFSGSKIALQPDGKLIVGGLSGGKFAAIRYNTDGTLDTSFGTNGMAKLRFDGEAQQSLADVMIQPDGKIVMVGDHTLGQSNFTDLLIARFNSNGTPDETFVANGFQIIDDTYFPNNRYNYAKAGAIQPDGKIVVSGNMMDNDGKNQLVMARVNADGSLDTTGFGTNGKGTVIFTFSNFQNYSLTIQTDGKILLLGAKDNGLAIVRCNSNGSLDTSFGGSGIVMTDFGAEEFPDDLVIQQDGKIIVAGTLTTIQGASDFLLARYNSDGSLDTSFGTNGKVTANFGSDQNTVTGIVLQPDNKVILVGNSGELAITARYDTGPSITTASLTFNSASAYDGWILESGENTNKGGTLDKKSNLIYVGDDAKDRQYRGILSFNTDSIPDNAVVTVGQLKIKRQSYVGTIPLKTHGAFQLEIRNAPFNNDVALTLEDFSAPASTGSTQDIFSGIDTNGIHTATLSNTNLGLINKSGVTQFRVSFSKDDNDDMGADYVKLFSGEITSPADQPQLSITYSTNSSEPTNQPPVITSNGGDAITNINLPENTSAVTTVTATDPDAQTLTYSISGGADAALFTVNPSAGTLSFVTAPSYNVPNDAGLDHVYNVTVQVSDGQLTDSQELVISIIAPPPPTGTILDSAFGSNGVVTTKINGLPSSALAVLLQPDGKVITLGTVQSQKVITRYNSNGSLDTSFGSNGSTLIGVTPFSGSKIALQPNGKLVVAGISQRGFAVVRYNSNGTLDTSFGTNGMGAIAASTDDENSVEDVTVQPDGKIVVVGSYHFNPGNHIDFQIVRFNNDGTRDVIDTIDLPYRQFDYGKAVVIQPDNKIVISGDMQGNDGEYYIALARQNPEVRPDKSTFGTNGSVVTPLDNFKNSSGALALQPDGKIIIAGTIFNGDLNVPQNIALARFNSNGSLDTTFGGTGIVVTDFGANESADDLVIQASGKIILAGTTSNQGSSDFLLVRYNSDGSLDTSFGSNGKLVTDFGNSAEAATGIVQQPDGKVIVSGTSGDNAILARYATGATGATGTTIATSFKSAGSYDGWILESGEFSNAGGTLDKSSNVVFVGDNDKDRQYRGILSFDTDAIPDNVTITSAQLKIKKQGVVGTDPFNTHGSLLLEIRKGAFNNNIGLSLEDFSAIAESDSTQDKFSAADSSWYAAELSSANLGLINKYGSSQFRLLFSKDDDDDLISDYVKFFSGNSTTSQPELFVTYSTTSGGTNSQAPVINGGSSLSVSIPENTTAVTAVTALDPDGQTITYSISGSDAGKFSINAGSGILTFTTAPDFESIPSGTIYHVTAQASDGSLTSTQGISVTVTPVNEFEPVATSSAGTNISMSENTINVTTITATDADLPAQSIEYIFAGGADDSLFNFDPLTGKLSFVTAPSYNAPNDAGLDHVYNVNFEINDGENVTHLDLVISINDPSSATSGFTALHQFGSQSNNGRVPYGVLVNYNGFMYGTTTYGGPPYNVAPTNPGNKGNVFKMNMDGTGFTVLHEFAGGANDGWKPWSGLAISGDMIYGSTVYGGPRGESGGVIYEMNINGSGFRVLHAFGETGDGFGGSTSPILVGDTLYGVTRWGGNGTGTVYSYNTSTEVYKQLHRFAANSSDGNAPLGTLTAGNDNYLYGLTWLGGKNNMGTLFRIKPDGSAFETLYNFAGGTQGKYPYDTLVFDGSHTLYGTTLGEYGVDLTDLGTVFKYDLSNKTYTVLHKFAGGANDSGKPNGSVVLSSDGVTLYGTTHGDDAWGGKEFGILYQMNIDGTGFKQLYEFSGSTTGATPMRTPLLIDGALYGMTAYGGTENYGLIYRYPVSDPSANAPALRMSFAALSDNLFNPTITSNSEVSVSENSIAATTITATDADNAAQPPTFSITGGADSTLFNINSSTGELAFVAAPNYEAPADAGLDNIYNLTIQASDGTLAVTQDIVVKVAAINDNNPAITSSNAVSIPENTTTVTKVTATDADLPTQSLTYSITGGSDLALFSVNSTTGELNFIAAPDFETPKDAGSDNIYNVTVQVSDGERVNTQDIAVTVTSVNDNNPVITSNGSVAVLENSTAMTTVTAKDADLPIQPLTYSIVGGSDLALFVINSSTGELTFITAPDYEIPKDAGSDNSYNVTVQASDAGLAGTQDIVVTVASVNDNNPVITSNGAVTVSENSTAATTITATDADLPAQSLTYSITGSPDSALFNINSSTGELNFITAPDFETPKDAGADNTYNVTIQVSDGELVSKQDIVITINSVNDNTPAITSISNPSILENSTAVVTVTATDADLPTQPLTYSITGGTDAALFNIKSSTGELTFITTPDFEIPTDAGVDNIYNVTVQASDGGLAISQDISLMVTAVNDNTPVITSTEGFAILENTTAISTVTAKDADLPAQTLTYSIIGGADSALFSIDSSTGALTFTTARDYETPKDIGNDNIYDVIVQASDGTLNVTQNITVTILGVNDNSPVITSPNSFSLPENSGIIATLVTTDADRPAEPLTYSIIGGLDKARFSIVSATGALTFISTPDFETPTDSNTDNVYEIEVQISDGTNNSKQNISIRVTNVDGS